MRLYPHRLLQLAVEPRVRFVAVSDALRQRAIEYGIPSEKIEVSYIGIDSTRFRPGQVPICQRDLQVLFVGRLVEKKGCRVLIEAMARVRQQLPQAKLTVIGDGVLRGELEVQAAKQGAPVTFLGARSTDDVKAEINKSRVLCLPSITASSGDAEGFGIVLLEAQASGVPVVTSALGGATEGILEGATGFPSQQEMYQRSLQS